MEICQDPSQIWILRGCKPEVRRVWHPPAGYLLVPLPDCIAMRCNAEGICQYLGIPGTLLLKLVLTLDHRDSPPALGDCCCCLPSECEGTCPGSGTRPPHWVDCCRCLPLSIKLLAPRRTSCSPPRRTTRFSRQQILGSAVSSLTASPSTRSSARPSTSRRR